MRLVLQMTDEEKRDPGAATAEAIAHEFSEAFDLIVAKNLDYGNAWQKQGWMGNLARIMSKCARLQYMLWRDNHYESSEEQVDETARDLMNICVFFLRNRAQQNRWGNGVHDE